VFDLDSDAHRELIEDEGELLQFAFRFLDQVLFGEMTIPVKEGARERRIAKRKERMEQRRSEEVQRQRGEDVYELARKGFPSSRDGD
jgi:hypothetical protein